MRFVWFHLCLPSGKPSSWLPRKLRLVIHDVLRKSHKLPKITLDMIETHDTTLMMFQQVAGRLSLAGVYLVPLM